MKTIAAIFISAFLFSGCSLQHEVAQLQTDVKELKQENAALRQEVGLLNNTIFFFPHE